MKNKLSYSIILNYICVALAIASSLIVVPFLKDSFGLRLFGVYNIATAVFAFLAVADFGIGNPFIRNMIKLKDHDKNSGGYIFGMFFVYLVFAVVVLAIFAVIYFAAPYVLDGELSELTAFRHMLIAISINCFLLFFQNYLFSIISAHDKLIFTRVCNVIKFSLRILLIIIIAQKGYPPYFVFAADAAITLGLIIIYLLYVYRLNVGTGMLQTYHTRIPMMFNTAKSMLLSYLSNMSENSVWTFCPMIIAIVLGPEEVGRYAIGIQFCYAYIQISTTLSHLRLPAVAHLWKYNNDNEYKEYIINAGKIQTIVLGLVVTGFAVVGRMFLKVWVGDGFEVSYYIALIVMSALFLPLSQSMLEVSLYAQNKYIYRAVILIASCVLNIVLMWKALDLFGLMGAAYTLSATIIILNFIAMNIYYGIRHSFMRSFNIAVTVKMVPIMIVAALSGFAVTYISPESLTLNILGGTATVVVYAVLVILFYTLPLHRKNG